MRPLRPGEVADAGAAHASAATATASAVEERWSLMVANLGSARGRHIGACPDVGSVWAWKHGAVGQSVLIVDDHADFRAFARALLDADGFDVVGEAHDGASALAAARSLKPALVLLDIQLPDIDGFAVCEQLAGDRDPPAIVLTSRRDASSYRRRLGESRALGFIPKAELSGRELATLAGG